ncbi:MFS-type transporter SLC18B1-like [Ptychodera flava]|uniref:MFS-type transporter SLC18B1-like n=1 Tax=Ptychodera flava TaxID=63121 RepID=UPI003969C114
MTVDEQTDDFTSNQDSDLSQTSDTANTLSDMKHVENGESVGSHLPKDDLLTGEEETASLCMMSSELKVLLTALSLTTYFYYTAFSTFAPLFPGVALKHGVTGAEIGLIMSSYALAATVQSSLSGIIIPKIGGRSGYVFGMFGASFTLISYGFLDKIDNEKTLLFIIIVCLLRMTEALFAILGLNAAVAIIFHQFPKSVQSKIFGTTNMFMGAGMTSGPLIGGILYDVGGYGLPFCVVGGCLLLTVPINYCVINIEFDSSKKKRDTSSIITLVRKAPAVIVPALVTMTTAFIYSFLMPILAIYLATEFLIRSKSIEGAMFSLLTLGYCIGSPLWGWIVGNKPKSLRWVIMFGLVLLTIPVFFVGPCPWFHIVPTLWLLGLSLFLTGIGNSVGVITIVEIMNKAKSGLKEHLSHSAMVSGVYYTAFSIGTVLGPFLGGSFYQFYGFGWTTTIAGFTCIGTCIIYGANMTRESMCSERSMDREDVEMNGSAQINDIANEKLPLNGDFPLYTE